MIIQIIEIMIKIWPFDFSWPFNFHYISLFSQCNFIRVLYFSRDFQNFFKSLIWTRFSPSNLVPTLWWTSKFHIPKSGNALQSFGDSLLQSHTPTLHKGNVFASVALVYQWFASLLFCLNLGCEPKVRVVMLYHLSSYFSNNQLS